MSIAEQAAILARLHDRLSDGEPLRLFVGDKLNCATEIVLSTGYLNALRLALLSDIADQFPPSTQIGGAVLTSQIIENNQQEGGVS